MDNKRPGGEMKSAGGQGPTKSQLLPMQTNWQDLLSKPYFWPGVGIVLATIALFGFIGPGAASITVKYYGVLPVKVPAYSVALATFVTVALAYGLYRMIGKAVPIWTIPVVIVVAAVLTESPIMLTLQKLTNFGMELPAQGEQSFVTRFIKMFFLAGIPEELLKAILVGVGVAIALKISQPPALLRPFRVAEPLDGVLIGALAGLGFAFVETVFLYVPRMMLGGDEYAAQLFTWFQGAVEKIGYEHAVVELQGYLPGREMALQLLIPRLLQNVCGHAAWAGIFGYYIGLAAMNPANRWKVLGIGLGIAAGMHAAWNAAGSDTVRLLVALGSFGVLGIVAMKARQISPNRAQLMPSQILDRFSRVHPAPAPQARQAEPPSPASKAASPSAAVAKSITWDEGSEVLLIEIGSARVPVNAGARLYERQAPGTSASRGDGIVAEVSAHPSDPSILGLRNLSKQIWEVTTAAGERRQLSEGRSIRITRGTRIQLGDLVAEVK